MSQAQWWEVSPAGVDLILTTPTAVGTDAAPPDCCRNRGSGWFPSSPQITNVASHRSDPGLWAPNRDAILLEEHDRCALGALFNIKDLRNRENAGPG